MPDSGRRDERTKEEIAEHYRLKAERVTKAKLARKEDRRLKSRDEREISRLAVREAEVKERKQRTRSRKAEKEAAWAHAREVERRLVVRGNARARQIEEAKELNRQRAREL